MTRAMVASERLSHRARGDRWCRVVFDHQLGRFGRRPVDQELDQSQRHVDPAGHPGRGDDPVVEVLDDPVVHRRSPRRPRVRRRSTSGVVAVRPVSSPAAASTRDPVQTDVVYGLVRWTPRTQSSTRSSCSSARVPNPPGKHQHIRCGHLFEGGVTGDAEHPVVAADLPGLVADEHDVEVEGCAGGPRRGRWHRVR